MLLGQKINYLTDNDYARNCIIVTYVYYVLWIVMYHNACYWCWIVSGIFFYYALFPNNLWPWSNLTRVNLSPLRILNSNFIRIRNLDHACVVVACYFVGRPIDFIRCFNRSHEKWEMLEQGALYKNKPDNALNFLRKSRIWFDNSKKHFFFLQIR